MILQALNDYYQRKAADSLSGIAPEGFEWKEIPFIVVIDQKGTFVTIEDTREGDGKKKTAKRFLVPAAEKRTVGIKANLLWDNAEYTLGANPRNRADVHERKSAFIHRLRSEFANDEAEKKVEPLIRFLENEPLAKIESATIDASLWQDLFENNANVIFRIAEAPEPTIIDELRPYIAAPIEGDGGICLVSGTQGAISRLHASIKGIRGAQSSGAALVSFNLPPFQSYGKTQNYNAPVSESAAFAYTTALNTLLGKESKNKLTIGDTATTVFWSEKSTAFETDFAAFFSFPPKDDPDADVRAVKKLYDGIYTGNNTTDSETDFYVLGLAPNAARISIRFWQKGTVKSLSQNIRKHFDDLEIIRSKNDKNHFALFWILSAMAQENKVDNIPPNLAGQIINAVLNGTQYPTTMHHQVIRRIRATQNVTRLQAAILKAYLNRFHRIHSTNEKEITVTLDMENNSPGYRLGRLFAILEKIQEEANPGINATIRDRFYGAASSTPVTVFPQLLKLKNHHLAKLSNTGRKVNFERMLAEVFSGITTEMPAHLAMGDQARFAIGYYHQRQALFESKTQS
ncbi:type I-C CRISPR-associated protein Cas8c/Csd1 [Chlorobium phaeovibrioides]|uniref:Type I-C CRISPR-associated protein Cas8c/Csd1 n=1 Tax=Chlorobium phaeovibrioides TaxID=1094 RepID=A0ABW9USP4_CHLPH|nr:type I-C CRISPR-associated protein Cas8c/Csd1 [Chlorobium phaeovibrioides]MWV55044.1 type I-C CRISPR-associated protein Cas8c/Csd1 [Chlorobium phaeovibrioides]